MSVRRITDSGRDHRDGVIEELAASEAELLARIATMTSWGRAYRELAKEAVHALAAMTNERDKYRRRLYELLDERRAERQKSAA